MDGWIYALGDMHHQEGPNPACRQLCFKGLGGFSIEQDRGDWRVDMECFSHSLDRLGRTGNVGYRNIHTYISIYIYIHACACIHPLFNVDSVVPCSLYLWFHGSWFPYIALQTPLKSTPLNVVRSIVK